MAQKRKKDTKKAANGGAEVVAEKGEHPLQDFIDLGVVTPVSDGDGGTEAGESGEEPDVGRKPEHEGAGEGPLVDEDSPQGEATGGDTKVPTAEPDSNAAVQHENDPGPDPNTDNDDNEDEMPDTTDPKTDEKKKDAPAQPALGLTEGKVEQIALDDIDEGDSTYRFRASLRIGPLKKSIEEQGQQLPIVLRARKQGQRKYQIISGFRRVEAVKAIGWAHIAAIVRSGLDDEEAFRASVLENTARKTYSDIDRALVIKEYEAQGHTSTDVADLMGLSKRQKNNLKALLDLPEDVQTAIDDPDQAFAATHALTLKRMASKYPELEQKGGMAKWIPEVNNKGLSVSQLTRAVNEAYKPDTVPGFTSLFQQRGTNVRKGEFRFSPVMVKVADLTDKEKTKLKAELEKLLKKLG